MGEGSVFMNRGQPGGPFSVVDFSDLQGEVFYVGSAAVFQGVAGVDATGYGRSPTAPFATIDYAVGQCTANQGDVIYVLPGHNEGLGNAQIDIDVAGVSVIGLGRGAKTPRIDFDHANASIDIGANNVRVKNLRLLPSVTDVLIGIDVEAGATDALIEDVVALAGEDGAGVDDFAAVVEFKAGCDRGTVRRLQVRCHASAAGYIAGVRLKGASDSITVEGCEMEMFGAALVAGINGDTTLSTNCVFRDNVFAMDAEPMIEMLTGTTGICLRCYCKTDIGTLNAAIVADTMSRFECLVAEPAEAGGLVGTATVDD